MKLTLSVLSIIGLCSISSAHEDWLQESISNRDASLEFFSKNRQRVDETILSLVDEIPQAPETPDTAIPESEGGETVAEADGGMLFDVANARMVYFGNVRVNDSRLKLKCADRLYIQLPHHTLEDGKKEAKEAVTPTTSPQETTTQITPKAEEDTEILEQPLQIEVGTAMVNTVLNKALLLGQNGKAISIIQEDNRVVLNAHEDGSPAMALAEDNGDLYINAGQIDIQWKDAKGNLCTLLNQGGVAYYNAEKGKILLTGNTQIQTAEGAISCTEEICLTLKREECAPDTDADAIMPQFGQFRITGIDGAKAYGQVQIAKVAANGSPAAAVTGSELSYDGTTGACSIKGENTVLTYGDNTLATNGQIALAGNGDITLEGDSINGTYSRPAETKDAAPMLGNYSTAGHITFNAAEGTISLPSGINLKDDSCTLTVGGAVTIKLIRNTEAKLPERSELGMINPAIAEYSDIEAIRAEGGISLCYLQGEEKKELTLTADEADIDMKLGTVTMASAGLTRVSYDTFSLTAESTDGPTSLVLNQAGDLSLQGDKVMAVLPAQDGTATVTCAQSLTLIRETGNLVLGQGALMESPQGRLTTAGPLSLTLKKGPEEKAHPLLPQFPHLVYNFDGLMQADTEQGGTLQTPDAAMRCSGRIRVEMNEEQGKSSSGNPMGAIRSALAEGNVAITAKDSTGRVITAYGDALSLNGETGEKRLSGNKVILQDKDNTHTASGSNAAIIMDKNNNVRVTGSKQSTSATNIRKQIEKQQKLNK